MPEKVEEKVSKVDVYDLKGKVIGKVTLSEEIFGVQVNEELIAQAIRVYLANKRQGTRKVKTRAEVVGSRRKIWRQKGTGRARHGDRYAPIFVGGGIAHGPKPKSFNLKLNKKMRRKALISSLSTKFKEKKIRVVEGFGKLTGRSREMVELLGNLDILDKNKKLKKGTQIITAENLTNVMRAGQNVANLNITEANLINCYEVLVNQWLIIDKDALKILKEMLSSRSSESKKTKVDKAETDKENRKLKIKNNK